MTDYQLQLKHILLFSAALRRLVKSEEFADDLHGAHAEANRLADAEMAAFHAEQHAVAHVSTARAAAEADSPEPRKDALAVSPGATVSTHAAAPVQSRSQAPEPPATSNWAAIVAATNKGILK
jgi:peptidoglycan hydrolase CwlO-like protein